MTETRLRAGFRFFSKQILQLRLLQSLPTLAMRVFIGEYRVMRRSSFVLLLLASQSFVYAQANDLACGSATQQAMPVRPIVIAPLAIELAPAATQLGNSASVLGQAFDEALSVDNVLLRIRLDGCQATAHAAPAGSIAKPDDPAAYKPRTEFDNTPWRFNMSQNGKNMTAEEFDAWMKSRGVRVAKGAAPAAVPAAVTAADPKKN